MPGRPKKVKKDFDKEKMYMKIMPSIVPADKPAPPAVSVMTEDAPAPPKAIRAEDVRLHNFMEDMVEEKLTHTMNVLGACACERCRMDILALALNQMPPAYAVAEPGNEHYIKKLKGAYEVKVTAALIKAIQQVKTNPRHG